MKTSTLAAVIAGAIALPAVTIGGAFAYNAYQHEQECKSYEKETIVLLDEGTELGEQVIGYGEMINRDPMSAFVLLGPVGQAAAKMQIISTKQTELRKEFVETCGANRWDTFVSSPTMSAKLETLTQLEKKANKLFTVM